MPSQLLRTKKGECPVEGLQPYNHRLTVVVKREPVLHHGLLHGLDDIPIVFLAVLSTKGVYGIERWDVGHIIGQERSLSLQDIGAQASHMACQAEEDVPPLPDFAGRLAAFHITYQLLVEGLVYIF